MIRWNFDNSYARLPAGFYQRIEPVPVKAPRACIFNTRLAKDLWLTTDPALSETDLATLAGNTVPEGAEPLAQAYAGHQFGNFVMLGDGRAIVLGEHCPPDGRRFDIQLKGSGQTRYSRRGDGRAALGPMLREYIISEAMAALGIPTTRSLAVVETGEPVHREKPLPGAVLTRIAASHIRVGTFQFAAACENTDMLQTLADYTIARHFSECRDCGNPYPGFYKKVIDLQAELIARWMNVGFIHGVMNTDNMAISGETIDYGPCAFMNTFNPLTVFSSIDYQGRYAYGNQPIMAQWNLARLAEAILPLLHPEPAQALKLAHEAIDSFPKIYLNHWLRGMRHKLGFNHALENDAALFEDLLKLMRVHRLDFTNTFRMLSHAVVHTYPPDQLPHSEDTAAWYLAWQIRLEREQALNPDWNTEKAQALMLATNPAYIPRNHRVEEALAAIVSNRDQAPLNLLLKALANPFNEKPEFAFLTEPPGLAEADYQTFCGT